jgi:hypothetical protein
MKEEYYRSAFVAHSYDSEKQALYTEWFKETEQMSAEDFKTEMEAWLKVSQETEAKFLFDYCVNFIYPIRPDEQLWMARLLKPGWAEVGLQRYAHVVPEEIIANLSVFQMFEEFDNIKTENEFEIRHFPEEESEEAKEWMLS